jgi:hypothetical protein
MLRQLAQCCDFAHVLPDVQVGFACDWAAPGACSTLDAFKKFVLLGEFLSIHLKHHFYVRREHKVIKAFSRECSESNHSIGDFTDGEEIA